MAHKNVLIESWLPIEAIGAESRRERGSSSALPPLYFLHVWWARRPLIASRAAILAGVLPAWSPDFPAELHEKFPGEESYHQWFMALCGIRGDPVKGMKLIQWAKGKGIQLDFSPYGGAPRAYTVNPSSDDLEIMGNLLEFTWDTQELSVLDPFAGGGSIPFEALRYGFTTLANDLNPVASVILKATLDYPARYGLSLADDIRKWGDVWCKKVKEKLSPYFPKQPNENIFAYLWARTIQWRGKTIPLSPNWWLRTDDSPVAVKVIAEEGMAVPRFEIVTGAKARAVNPDVGTISRGVARSPWTGETIDGDYIKAEAQAGRMGQILYAVALKIRGGFEFRSPTCEDITAETKAKEALEKNRADWIAKDIIPIEAFPPGNDNRPLIYGMPTWDDFLSPRQLLAMGTFVECLRELEKEIRKVEQKEKADALVTFMAIAMDKCPNYNSRMSVWHPLRTSMANTFNRHDFSFAWSHGEFDAAGNLLPWAVNQIEDAYRELAKLVYPSQATFFEQRKTKIINNLNLYKGSASKLAKIPDASIENITVDPPYYDNVQYAELSDFFYVWLKRSVGHLFPEFFQDELTNKDDEAVANPARFKDLTPAPSPTRRVVKAKELANQDYERKMAAAFREMYRVLRPDGVLTVMFTHKRVEAWDTLASALIGAGFTIKASWPVHTESEHSLHQAKKNAASSTIMLVCRKRPSPPSAASLRPPLPQAGEGWGEGVWWEDIQNKVRQTAREKASEFVQMGIHGVDLYIATFGPTLSIISEHWPVLTSEVDEKTGKPKALRPGTALDLAREEVVRLRKQGLLLGREVQFDPITDWYLMAWDAFGAEQFPYDEARKLAIALGIELDGELMKHKRLVTKKGEFVVLQPPTQRRKRGMVDDEVTTFANWVDAVHTAMMVYQEDGAGACDVFLMKASLKRDATFKACLQAMLNAIPRARIKGNFVRPEAKVLENMRLAFFDDLKVPVEEEPELLQEKQLGFSFSEIKETEEENEDQSL